MREVRAALVDAPAVIRGVTGNETRGKHLPKSGCVVVQETLIVVT
jgi:hypothetical protein